MTEIPKSGEFVVIECWGKGLRMIRYIGPGLGPARELLTATRRKRAKAERLHKKGARPRAFLARIEEED